jgi:hypothetical protein
MLMKLKTETSSPLFENLRTESALPIAATQSKVAHCAWFTRFSAPKDTVEPSCNKCRILKELPYWAKSTADNVFSSRPIALSEKLEARRSMSYADVPVQSSEPFFES